MVRSSLATLLLAATSATAQMTIAPSLGYMVLNTFLPVRSGNYQLFQFTANGGSFYAGDYASTKSSCDAQCCPQGLTTSFFSAANSLDDAGSSAPSALFLNSMTASKGNTQKVFIAADGSLGYTSPDGKIPSDAITSSFIYSPEKTRSSYGDVAAKGRDFIACKVDTYYQVKTIETGGKLPDGCIAGAAASRPSWDGISAGQYDGGV